ncbi:hypothetical protein LTR91_017656 [Friedmanniomyces endolithicus]|uniref:Hypercellular protein HypA n=1 Tax=Friedmanniomyces endolithicus TaxID=329885 RepID=A0AAN6K5Q5_9PEZI|nr:hypothetical protein LTR91_017656 [Friedmanniomyces endolithicus]
MGRFSPVAPARVRMQVVPVGRIERSRFNAVVNALVQYASIVKLVDIETRDDQQFLLSPKAFPQGSLLFSYHTSPPSVAEYQLSPYELFRSPQLVLGIVGGFDSEKEDKETGELGKATETLREHYPHAIHRHILLLPEAEGGPHAKGENVSRIAKSDDDEGGLALHDAVCEAAACFLAELSTYAKATQASPTIQTPGQKFSNRLSAWSLRSDDDSNNNNNSNNNKVSSGYSTPTQSAEVNSPVGGDEDSSRPPSRGIRSPPPSSSTEQTHSSNTAPSASARSDSRNSDNSRQSGRPGSQDRAPVHAIAPMGSQSKSKARGKARVGIVVGHIYIMAGHWSEALRTLIEHTNAAKKHSDPLWHAKGLEGIVVSMLLLAWTGSEFSIPSICYPAAERSHSSHVHKLSIHSAADFRPADAAHQASVRRLSTSLPDLLKQILSLYESSEGSLELPTLMLAEIKIRFCNLMAVVYQSNNELSGLTLTAIVTDNCEAVTKKLSGSGPSGSLSKPSIAAIINEALQADLEILTTSDQVTILAGAYNVYAMLNMDRKGAAVLKDIMAVLTAALDQASRLRAAEAGIHPAASLSADTIVDPIATVAADSGGINNIVSRIAQIYGIHLLSTSAENNRSDLLQFGNKALKSELLKAIVSFCEATPNPEGMLRATAALFKTSTMFAVMDPSPSQPGTLITRDEQLRLATTFAKTVAVSKHMGMFNVQAQFWDELLVRGLAFEPRDEVHNIVPHCLDRHAAKVALQPQISGNPLIYDPNALRDVAIVQHRQIIIRNEPQKCYLTLQNPLDIPVEVESIELVTGGHEYMWLDTKDFSAITLEPLQIQPVCLFVAPSTIGDFNIIGCRVKVASCGEQFFPIFTEPWAPTPEQLVKHQGQSALEANARALVAMPKRMIVPVTSAPTMPVLEVESISAPESHLVLLDGEEQTVNIVLRNTSGVPAEIYNVCDEECNMHLSDSGTFLTESHNSTLDEPKGWALVKPGESVLFSVSVIGHNGETKALLDIYYRPCPYSRVDAYARVLRLPFTLTVHPALLLHTSDASDIDDNFFSLSFHVTNAWTNPIGIRFEIRYPLHLPDNMQPDADAQLLPGETRLVDLVLHRDLFRSWPHDTDAELEMVLWRTIVLIWQEWSPPSPSSPLVRSGRTLLRDLRLFGDELAFVRGAVLRVSHSVPRPHTASVSWPCTVRFHMENRTESPSPTLAVRLAAVQQGAPDAAAVAFTGSQARGVNSIAAGATVAVDFVVSVTTRGRVRLAGEYGPLGLEGQGMERWSGRVWVEFEAV